MQFSAAYLNHLAFVYCYCVYTYIGIALAVKGKILSRKCHINIAAIISSCINSPPFLVPSLSSCLCVSHIVSELQLLRFISIFITLLS